MTPTPVLLVCGFGPFPGVPDNPAGAAVERLRAGGWAPEGARAAYTLLPTTWAGAVDTLAEAVERSGAGAVLLVGVASEARTFRVELQARNHAATHRPDVEGALRPGECIVADGVAVAACTAPAPDMVQAIRAEGLACEPSSDAGDYLCNYTFYRALTDGAVGQAAFLHVPPPGKTITATDIERAVKAAARAFAHALANVSAPPQDG